MSSASHTSTARRSCSGAIFEETLANVARFSKKDAATFRDWNRRAEEITTRIFLPERFSHENFRLRMAGIAVMAVWLLMGAIGLSWP